MPLQIGSPYCTMILVIKMILEHIVTKDQNSKTVGTILKYSMGLSGRLIKRLKYSGSILCNSQPVFVNHTVSEGDKIEAVIEFDDTNEDIIPQDIPIDIIYEDDSIIAINKQPDICVHPTCYHPSGTVANALMFHFTRNDVRTRIRPVSRLDRNTSGIILFAKNQFIQENLIKQMSAKTFVKDYKGIVTGIVEPASGTIDLPIERAPDSIMVRRVSSTGAPSITHFRVLEYLNKATLLDFRLETGRTHQIRVHCQATGHPLLGDSLYPSLDGKELIVPAPINRQALHSSRTVFLHPITGDTVELNAPLPEDMLQALEILRK